MLFQFSTTNTSSKIRLFRPLPVKNLSATILHLTLHAMYATAAAVIGMNTGATSDMPPVLPAADAIPFPYLAIPLLSGASATWSVEVRRAGTFPKMRLLAPVSSSTKTTTTQSGAARR